jgi:hypothetical protein
VELGETKKRGYTVFPFRRITIMIILSTTTVATLSPVIPIHGKPSQALYCPDSPVNLISSGAMKQDGIEHGHNKERLVW